MGGPQDTICDNSMTISFLIFANFSLLCVSKIQIYIDIYNLHSEYVSFSHCVREFLILKNIIKEVIENFGMDSEKLKFVSSSTIY